jgi:hypothetical protein
MSVVDRIQQGLRALEEANAERAWAAVGGLIAIIGATCAVFLAVVLVMPGSLVEKSLSIVAAVGSIIGTASLFFFAWPANPDSSIRPYAYKGLWIGNLAAAGFVLWVPLLVILAAIPNLAGFMIVRRIPQGCAAFYISLPYVALAITTVIRREIGIL